MNAYINFKFLILFLVLIFLFGVSLFAEQTEKEKVFFNDEKKNYVQLIPAFQDDVEEIFENYPLYTNLSFVVPYVKDTVLDKLFTDLVFTSIAARQYVKSPYIVEDKQTHFRAYIPELIDGKINIAYEDTNKNRFVYVIQGYYDTFVTLRGKMLVDIKYVFRGENLAQFYVKAYVIVTNSTLWKLARYLKSYPSFQEKIDNLFRKNINFTIYLGRKTVYGIQGNLQKKEF